MTQFQIIAAGLVFLINLSQLTVILGRENLDWSVNKPVGHFLDSGCYGRAYLTVGGATHGQVGGPDLCKKTD